MASITKPFNLEQALMGKPVVTNTGRLIGSIKKDVSGSHLECRLKYSSKTWLCDFDGFRSFDSTNNDRLFMLDENVDTLYKSVINIS